MQTETSLDVHHDVDLAEGEPAQPESPELNPYAEALAQIESGLAQLASGFAELDDLQSEEQQLAAACEQAASEESRILADSDATEAQSVKKLIEIRAKKDLRSQRLLEHKTAINLYTDRLRFDLCEPLRRNFTNLAFALLAARRERMEKLFHQLFGNGADHGLPVSTVELTQRSRPVLDLERLCNWIRDAGKDPQEELTQLRSELPRRWLIELRRVTQEEFNEFESAKDNART